MSPKEERNMDRRKADDEFKIQVRDFISRTDERNKDRDLTHAIQGEVIDGLDTRLVSVEKSRDRMEFAAMSVPAVGSLAWACFKLGQVLKGRI